MTRPRKITGLIARVLEADPKATRIIYERRTKALTVELVNAHAWVELTEEIDLPLKGRDHYYVPLNDMSREQRFMLVWDCSSMGQDEAEHGTGFAFGQGAEKRARRRVDEQEEEGARIIGGRRHAGSGAISGLKSDASSAAWQQESKQTRNKSFGLSLEILEKISREARVQDKKPMVFLRFTDVPEHMAVEPDWVIVPKSAFEEMDG